MLVMLESSGDGHWPSEELYVLRGVLVSSVKAGALTIATH